MDDGIIAAAAVAVGGKAKDKSNASILAAARSRLDLAVSALSDSRTDENDDLKFYAGSPDNHWQWPADVLATRGAVQGQSYPSTFAKSLTTSARTVRALKLFLLTTTLTLRLQRSLMA